MIEFEKGLEGIVLRPTLSLQGIRMMATLRTRAHSLWAPAKINLFLEVTGRRADGYHDLVTVMAAVSLFDTLHFVPLSQSQNTTQLTVTDVRTRDCSGMRTPLPANVRDNLVMRTIELVRKHSGVTAGIAVHLTKRIPLEAGLGGGSSDAATTLMGLNRIWDLGFSSARMMEIAAEIGSDVPFFIHGGWGICEGRGDRVQRIPRSPPLALVLAVPPQGLSTREIFSEDCVAPAWNSDMVLPWLRTRTPMEIGRALHNRLTNVAIRRSPWIRTLFAFLKREHVLGYSMTGSGSACFAICRHWRQAWGLAGRLRCQNIHAYCIHSLPPPPSLTSAA